MKRPHRSARNRPDPSGPNDPNAAGKGQAAKLDQTWPSPAFVGDLISVVRRHSGLTQESFAREVGISRSVVAQMETGRGGDAPHIKRIAEILEVPEETFLNRMSMDTVQIDLSFDEVALLRFYRACPTGTKLGLIRTAHAAGVGSASK